MAWPYSNYWTNMHAPPPPPQPHPAHGAGVDHAAPHHQRQHHHHGGPPGPPPDVPNFMNPDFWARWTQRRGWEDFIPGGPNGPYARASRGEPWAHDPYHYRGEHRGEEQPHRRGEMYPPEYASDNEGAAPDGERHSTGNEKQAKDGQRAADGEKTDSPDTLMHEDAEDPPEEIPHNDNAQEQEEDGPGRCGPGRRGGGGRRRGFGGPRRGGFGRDGFGRGFHGHHAGPPFDGPHRRRHRHPHGPPPPPPPPPPPFFTEGFFGAPHHRHRGRGRGRGPFDFRAMLAALASYPNAQQLRSYLERAQEQERDFARAADESSDEEEGLVEHEETFFAPPLDLFEQADQWVLHLAVPGAKKEDIGVHWDPDRGVLRIAGVVLRPGNEEFLKGLVSGERRVGLFSREVPLPPEVVYDDDEKKREKEEVNAEGIVAKMEDGVLIITVPKVESQWTEIRSVEIQ